MPTLLTTVLFIASAALPLHAQYGLGLTPMRLEFPAVAGTAHSGALSVSNSGGTKIRVRTQILDFYVDANQTPQYMDEVPAEVEYSCRKWITVNPMEIEVEAKRQVSARYTIRVPAAARQASHHCAIGFVTLPTNEEIQGIGVRTAIRVVTAIYPIVGKPEIKASIFALALEDVAAGDRRVWRAIVVMENAGEMLYRPMGSVEVVDAAGKVSEKLVMPSFPVLPNRRQRFILPMKNDLAAGPYTLRAHIDVGGEVQEASVQVVSALPK